jgi:hypothetical protein
VAQAFNPSTWEGRGRRISEFEAKAGLQSEFQDSQGYTEKLSWKTKKKKKRKKKTEALSQCVKNITDLINQEFNPRLQLLSKL